LNYKRASVEFDVAALVCRKHLSKHSLSMSKLKVFDVHIAFRV